MTQITKDAYMVFVGQGFEPHMYCLGVLNKVWHYDIGIVYKTIAYFTMAYMALGSC